VTSSSSSTASPEEQAVVTSSSSSTASSDESSEDSGSGSKSIGMPSPEEARQMANALKNLQTGVDGAYVSDPDEVIDVSGDDIDNQGLDLFRSYSEESKADTNAFDARSGESSDSAKELASKKSVDGEDVEDVDGLLAIFGFKGNVRSVDSKNSEGNNSGEGSSTGVTTEENSDSSRSASKGSDGLSDAGSTEISDSELVLEQPVGGTDVSNPADETEDFSKENEIQKEIVGQQGKSEQIDKDTSENQTWDLAWVSAIITQHKKYVMGGAVATGLLALLYAAYQYNYLPLNYMMG